MRHLKVVNHLGRTSSHRKAMLANMASSLIMNKRISTTEAKAKALRTYIEPLITRSKEDTTHSRRVVFSHLRDKEAVAELFREVSPKVAERPGGYTRILKTGNRFGDNASMCIIELVDFNESMLAATEAKAKAARRRRGPRRKTEASAATAVAEPATGQIAAKAAGTVEEDTNQADVSETVALQDTEPLAETDTESDVLKEEDSSTEADKE